jgi:hypothetical protein
MVEGWIEAGGQRIHYSGLKWVGPLSVSKNRINMAMGYIKVARLLQDDRFARATLRKNSGDIETDMLLLGEGCTSDMLRGLATELAFKAVYEWETQTVAPQGHKLTRLYGKLCVDSQYRLKERYQRQMAEEEEEQVPLEALLNECDDLFERERYATEKGYWQSQVGVSSLNIRFLDWVVIAAWKLCITAPHNSDRIDLLPGRL